MKSVRTLVFVVLFSGMAAAVWSAQPVVETFSGGANGWIGSAPLGGATWAFTGGAARVTFGTIGIPIFSEGVLSNSPSASSGSFTGNYDLAAITVMGFSILAPTHLPSSLTLQWGGGTSVFQRSFSVTETGVWYSFTASLADEAGDEWTPVGFTSLDDFAAARQSVSYMAIKVIRSGTTQRQYVFDDIFLAGQPRGASLTRDSGGIITWDGLVAGIGYQVQSTTNLISAFWVGVESLTATGYLHTTIITNETHPVKLFRIQFD